MMKQWLVAFLIACFNSPAVVAAPLQDAEWLLLDIENHRRAEDPILRAALMSSVPHLQSRALEVMGRIGDARFIDDIKPFLTHARLDTRSTAAFALGQIGGKASAKILLAALVTEQEAAVRSAIALSLGWCMDGDEGPSLTPLFLNETTLSVRLAMAQALGQTWGRNREDWVLPDTVWKTLLTDALGVGGVQAAFALARFPGAQRAEFLPALADVLAKTRAEAAKPYLVRAMGNVKTEATVTALEKVLSSQEAVGVKVEAVNALGKQTASGVIEPLIKMLASQNAQLVIATLDALKKVGPLNTATAIKSIEALYHSHPSDWIRAQALLTLVQLKTKSGRELVEAELASPTGRQRELAAIQSLALLGEKQDVKRILALAQDADVNKAGTALEALVSAPKDLLANEDLADTFHGASLRGDIRLTCDLVDVIVQFERKEFVKELIQTYSLFDKKADGRVCILNAVAFSKEASYLTVVEQALDDTSSAVAAAARNAYEAITGQTAPTTSKTELDVLPTPSRKEVEQALGAPVVLNTTRGEVHIRMLPSAPLTATMFVRLVKEGFYRGLTFHRVVPNFVAQGGDPRGDGWGGLEQVVPSEHSFVSHYKTTLGIATSGKDTGSCQFFINENDNLHLDGQYTVFAYVEKGFEHVLELEQGDLVFQ